MLLFSSRALSTTFSRCRPLYNYSASAYTKKKFIPNTTPLQYSTTLPIITPVANTSIVRFYARRSTRTRVEEEEEVAQQQRRGTTDLQQGPRPAIWQDIKQEPKDSEVSTEQSLTDDIRRHLSKVYGTLMAGLGFTTIGTVTSLLVAPAILPMLSLIGGVGSLVGVLVLAFGDKSKASFRQNVFLAVCGLTGLSIAPLIASSSAGVVLAAALGTSAIFGGFTLAALKAKQKSMLMLGGVLFGGLLLVFTCGVAGLILPLIGITNPAILGALYNVNLYLGLGIFSLYIAYDTQRMIEDYRNGITDHVGPALGLFLDIINIFIRLLQIFGRR